MAGTRPLAAFVLGEIPLPPKSDWFRHPNETDQQLFHVHEWDVYFTDPHCELDWLIHCGVAKEAERRKLIKRLNAGITKYNFISEFPSHQRVEPKK